MGELSGTSRVTAGIGLFGSWGLTGFPSCRSGQGTYPARKPGSAGARKPGKSSPAWLDPQKMRGITMSARPGKTVLITGANAGIGKDVAGNWHYVRHGPHLPGVPEQRRATTAKAELEAKTGRPIFDIIVMDVADLGSSATA